MAIANTAFCVFLGLKNTPLQFLAATSYSRLNTFHRLAGYTVVFMVLLHAIFYASYFGGKHEWATLIEPGNWEGLLAGVAMLVMLLGIARNRNYEAFYVSHLLGFATVVIVTALHRPDWAKKVPIAMIFIACLWALDRIKRLGRLLYNYVNNEAILQPLPAGGTRMTLKKPLYGAVPGTHCFVWIPRIRFWQTHPFTIVSNSSSGLELVMKSHSGFTKHAFDLASIGTSKAVSVSIDGPYGSIPDLREHDKLILIAGGSGATFTFGLATSFLMQRKADSTQSMDFIWAVKSKGMINPYCWPFEG